VDEVGGGPAIRPNSLHLFAISGNYCDEFRVGSAAGSNLLQLLAVSGDYCDKFGMGPAGGDRNLATASVADRSQGPRRVADRAGVVAASVVRVASGGSGSA
jgi:hypothetical protein